MFRAGLIINPWAGIGGPTALKGSDGEAIRTQAIRAGAQQRAVARATETLRGLSDLVPQLQLFGATADMGQCAAEQAGLPFEPVMQVQQPSTAEDTRKVAEQLLRQRLDLLLFAGGDGTARDICSVVGESLPVLGIPAGVKMHSGVFAISPAAATAVVRALVLGELVDVGLAEVRDIDEEAFRQGRVNSRYYGEMQVPRLGQFVQQVKSSGREVEALVLQDIAASLIEDMDADTLYLVGPGSTTQGFLQAMQLPATLLGVDAVLDQQLLAADLDEPALRALVNAHQGEVKIVLTAIGGQGHILGRGNQQFSPALLRQVGIDNVVVIATKTKIRELAGRPLWVDSGDPALDRQFCGWRRVITGYRDEILYQVAAG